MLAITNITSFGVGPGASAFNVQTGTDANTDSPSMSIDLGPPGAKQVICAFASRDTGASDQFSVSATLDGDAMREVREAGYFDGSIITIGVSIQVIDTIKGGTVNVVLNIAGFSGTMDRTRMMAIVCRGYDTTEVDFVSTAQGQDSDNGNQITGLDTTDAVLVVITGADIAAEPGTITGAGTNPVTVIEASNISIGYRLDPVGTSNDYDFSGDTDAIVAASFKRL